MPLTLTCEEIGYITKNDSHFTKNGVYLERGYFYLLPVFVCGTEHCNAQTVVGKWKQVSVKMFCTPDAIKNSHRRLQDVMDMPKVEAVDETPHREHEQYQEKR